MRNFIKLSILLIIGAVSTPSLACEPFILLGNVSHHFGDKHKYNEEHPTIGGGCEFEDGSITWSTSALYTKNSFDRDSVYLTGQVGYTIYKDKEYKSSVGLIGGAGNGYEPIKKSKGGWIPLLGATAEGCKGKNCLYTLAFPPFSNADGVVILGYKRKF